MFDSISEDEDDDGDGNNKTSIKAMPSKIGPTIVGPNAKRVYVSSNIVQPFERAAVTKGGLCQCVMRVDRQSQSDVVGLGRYKNVYFQRNQMASLVTVTRRAQIEKKYCVQQKHNQKKVVL